MKNFNLNNLNSPDYEFLFGEKRMVCFGKPDNKSPQNIIRNEDLPDNEAERDKNGTSKNSPSEGKGNKDEKDEVIAETPEKLKVLKKDIVQMHAAQERKALKKGLPKPPVKPEEAKGQQEVLKRKPLAIPEKPKMTTEKFVKEVNERSQKKGMDEWTVNILHSRNKINAESWNHNTVAGVERIWEDCRTAGIIDRNPDFYGKLFSILKNSADTKNLNSFTKVQKGWLLDPITNADKLAGLPANGDFPGGDAFVKAYQHLQWLKELLVTQDNVRAINQLKQNEMDSDPVMGKVTDFLHANLNKFTGAVRDKDWATAGLYVAGAWAIYRSLQNLGILGKDGQKGKATKWLAYGIGAYAGHLLLKNAGYDVLKMTGLQANNFEVKGTPFEVIDRILKAHPDLKIKEMTKNLDHSMFLRLSETDPAALHKLFLESNSHGTQFIHPDEFPNIFPDTAGQKPMYTPGQPGFEQVKLTLGQKKYIKLGQQLYKTAVALKAVYETTLMKDENSSYFRMTYEQAITSGARKFGTISYFIASIAKYSTAEVSRGLFSSRATVKEAEEHLNAVFEGSKTSWHLEQASNIPGHYNGWINSFPVVFVRDGNNYRVYLKNEYKGAVHGANPAAILPISIEKKEEGKGKDAISASATEEIKNVNKAIDNRAKELMRYLKFDEKEAANPVFDGSKWTCTVTLPQNPEFEQQAQTAKANITFNEDGKGLILEDVDKKLFRIDVAEDVASQTPNTFGLVSRILQQDEFRTLAVFNRVSRLKIRDDVKKDKKFTLLVGTNNLPLEFKYIPEVKAGKGIKFEKGTFKFADENQEKKLLQDPTFANAYIDALAEDRNSELNETLDSLKKIITNSTPEKFVSYGWKSLFGVTASSPLGKDLFSGSVPENFTKMILDVGNQEVMEKLRRKIKDAGSLKEVEDARKNILADFVSRLKGTESVLSSENRRLKAEGKEWDRDMFMMLVVDRVRSSASESSSYSLAKAEMEYIVYKNLPGFLAGSDINVASHQMAAKLMGVFVYYTSHLDNPNLDNLKYPPDPKDLQGHYSLRYFEYVQNKITDKINGNLRIVPNGSDSNFWGIQEFDQWVKSEGQSYPLDSLDNKPPFEHNEKHPGFKPTELDKYMAGEYRKAAAFLITNYGNILRHNAVSDALQKDPWETSTTLRPIGEIGLLKTYPIFKNGKFTDEYNCKLWDKTNRISQHSAILGKKRSVQIRLVQEEVAKWLENIFTEKLPNGELKYMTEKPSWIDEVKRWPGIKHVRDWFKK